MLLWQRGSIGLFVFCLPFWHGFFFGHSISKMARMFKDNSLAFRTLNISAHTAQYLAESQ
jgi:hypothetical protein